MEIRKGASVCLTLTLLIVSSMVLRAQKAPNANAFYQQLRSLMPDGVVFSVNHLELKRDAATFTFNGSFEFYGAVNGKVTGAVFRGDGHVHITPPTQQERNNLAIFTHTQEFDEDFDEAVLRFTDGTADELKKASAGAGQDADSFTRPAQDLKSLLRHHSILSYTDDSGTYYDKIFYGNLDLRLLQDVLSPAPGGYFFAALHGKRNGQLFFVVDPNGVGEVAPEEVALMHWDSSNEATTYPLAFRRAAEYANGTPSGDEQNAEYKIVDENLDVTIEKGGMLSSVATVELRANQDGVVVVPLNLYPSLRVNKVETDKGDALDFVQEEKDQDPDFGVVLGAPLKKGDTAKVRITYGGKNVVMNMGNGNYYPVARENWYPSSNQGLGDYDVYQMKFHVPKGLQLIATGTKMNESNEGKYTTTEWKTETPLPVVGFSLGDFKSKEATLGNAVQGQLTLDAYANTTPPDYLEKIAESSSGVLGTLEATPMLASELSQGQAALQIYTQYYGQLPFPHVALTEQSACNYGQSWPMLVYLPVCGFMDITQQHFLGLGGENLNKHMYWEVVTPHEVAHQWWGQTVGFRGYRDQWMSEGFADASAALFLLITRPNPNDYLRFWKEERRILTDKNQFGFRPVDVGPVTMGVRLSSNRAGLNIYGDLVYPKGAFILHMIQMMMWTPKESDGPYKAMMHDFVSTYQLRPATTEDFKAMVEKHMSPAMNLDGNGRMDWFFNEYVYGTELPVYHFEGDATPSGDGNAVHIKLVQSGVSDSFKALVPIYLELANGQILRMGQMRMAGNWTYEHTFNLPKLPAPITNVSINHYYDVLCTEN
ncbi:MAG: M1 family metallopeptidase [Terracidiphilus sp.]